MNTTLINSSTADPMPIERLGHYDPEVHQRVQQWLASGQLLDWIPILSQENFPDVPPQILQFATGRLDSKYHCIVFSHQIRLDSIITGQITSVAFQRIPRATR